MRFIVLKLHLWSAAPRRTWCRCWSRLSFGPEKPFEKVTRPLRNWSGNRLSTRGTRTLNLAGSVGFRLNIRLSTAIGHLHRGAALTGIGAFLVLAAEITSSVAH